MRRAPLAAVFLTAALQMFPATAQARSESVVRYTKVQTFSSALRYLRVDLGYSVTEKDADAAYLMFEFPRNDQKKLGLGTIEIVETSDAVKLVVRVPELPEYQEQILADGLLKKLKSEHGEPPPRKPAQPQPTEPPKAEPPRDGAAAKKRDSAPKPAPSS